MDGMTWIAKDIKITKVAKGYKGFDVVERHVLNGQWETAINQP